MTGLDDLKLLDEWYKAAIAAGAVIAVPAVTVAHKPGLCMAVGLILFGVGEYINHPFRSRMLHGDHGGLIGIAKGRPRSPKLFGWFLDGIGVAFFGYGAWLLLAG